MTRNATRRLNDAIRALQTEITVRIWIELAVTAAAVAWAFYFY